MGDSRKYYYMRLKEDFFDSDEMIVLESLPDGVIYQNILLKMYCRSLKSEGRLMLNGIIPYNPQMLASVTRQQVGTVEKALELFKQLGLIDILDNGAIYMLNIQNYIGTSSTEADRVRKYRDQITTEKQEVCTNVQHLYSRDRDKDRDRDRDKDNNARAREEAADDEKVPYKKIMELYNSICVHYPSIRDINGKRKQAVSARYKANPDLEVFRRLFEKAEASKFLQGNNDRGFKADFDFMVNASRFDRLLEGAYDDRELERRDGRNDADNGGENNINPNASYDRTLIEQSSLDLYKDL